MVSAAIMEAQVEQIPQAQRGFGVLHCSKLMEEQWHW